MVHLPLDGTITRRELLTELMVVWLFIVFIATDATGPDAGWRDLLLPVGAMMMLGLHVWALWRGSRRSDSGVTRGDHAG